MVASDLAAERREQVAHGLDRFDHPERRELLDRPADVRQLDEDDVAQLVGRVLGDPDGGGVAVEADPLVILGVAQIVGDHRGWEPPAGAGDQPGRR